METDDRAGATGGRRAVWTVVAAAALVAAVVVAFQFASRPRAGEASKIAGAAPREYRIISARVAGMPWAPLRNPRSGPDDPYLQLAVRSQEVVARAQRDADAENAHAAGVAKLLHGDSEDAVIWLTRATDLEPRDAQMQSDLAAALLVRGIAANHRPSMELALVAADRALSLDEGQLEAAFNRALALDVLGRSDEAAKAWKSYLEVDTSSAWAREARARLGRR